MVTGLDLLFLEVNNLEDSLSFYHDRLGFEIESNNASAEPPIASVRAGSLRITLVQQIETIGPRQWLSLMAGSIVFSAPVSQRIARAFPRRFVPFADGGIIGGNTA